jgi:hypothetical protein
MPQIGCESCGPEDSAEFVERPPILRGIGQVSVGRVFNVCRDYLLQGTYEALEYAAMEQYFKRHTDIMSLASRCAGKIRANQCSVFFQLIKEGEEVTVRRSDAVAAGVLAARPVETVEATNYL